MKVTQLGSQVVRAGAVCAMVVLSLIAAPALAATIEIGFTGMDLVYDGSAFYDAGSTSGGFADPADADPLSSAVFTVDSVPVGTITSNISLDAYIPDVTGIPSAPNTTNVQTTPGNPGYFDLLIGTTPLASQFLLVDLSDVTVTYVDVQNIVQFTFGAAVSSSFAQNLPFGLTIGDPITVAFSAQIVPGTKTSSGGVVTGFRALGTGNYQGDSVPEPTTCLLAAMGLMALAIRRK